MKKFFQIIWVFIFAFALGLSGCQIDDGDTKDDTRDPMRVPDVNELPAFPDAFPGAANEASARAILALFRTTRLLQQIRGDMRATWEA